MAPFSPQKGLIFRALKIWSEWPLCDQAWFLKDLNIIVIWYTFATHTSVHWLQCDWGDTLENLI